LTVPTGPCLFSIIIPTYNVGKTLSSSIQSATRQKYTNFELLIVDGQSRDNTVDIINEYVSKDIRIKSTSEKDKGIYDAMNKGIKISKGEWLYFMGADDELYNDEVLLSVSAEIGKSSGPIIYGNVKIKGDCPWGKDGDIYAGEFDLKKLLTQNISHQAIFYKRALFDELGFFDINYKINSDWDFNLHCFSKLRFHYCDMIIALYAAGGISTIDIDKSYFNDRLQNIVIYFQNQLYKDEFVKDRYAFRKLILKRDSRLSWVVKMKLFFSVIILQFKAWKSRVRTNR
jgi:glycosyltransferase involved in cell wall biosynthesis